MYAYNILHARRMTDAQTDLVLKSSCLLLNGRTFSVARKIAKRPLRSTRLMTRSKDSLSKLRHASLHGINVYNMTERRKNWANCRFRSQLLGNQNRKWRRFARVWRKAEDSETSYPLITIWMRRSNTMNTNSRNHMKDWRSCLEVFTMWNT